jgi:predicted PurR-regulated permease PerM
MARHVSFFVLLGATLAAAVLFYWIVEPFLIPLLLAAILALLCYPAYERLVRAFRGYRRIAAGAATAIILVLVFLPMVGALFLAGQELLGVAEDLKQVRLTDIPLAENVVQFIERQTTVEEMDQIRGAAMDAGRNLLVGIYNRTEALLSGVVGFIIGLAILAVALYYFLAEGPDILRSLQKLSPLDDRDEFQLFQEFDKVCRGIVLATLVAAGVQAVLAGIGFAVVGAGRVWFLSLCTLLAALIPFLGAGVVWFVVAGVLLFQERYVAGIGLAVYGIVVVSSADNLVRAYVVHGQSRVHPLVVLVTMLGGIYVIGLWGVFIGPIVAGFLHALLVILRNRTQSDSMERRDIIEVVEERRKPLVTEPAPARVNSGKAPTVTSAGHA